MTIAAQLGRISSNLESSTRAREFCALARCLALSKGSQGMARQLASEARLSKTIVDILAGDRVPSLSRELVQQQRAAVVAGSTSDASWALPLANYDVLAGAFLESLRSYGVFDRMLPSMRRVPFRARVGAASVGVTGDVINQASIKPIGRLTLTGGTVDELKAVAIVVVTQELARFSQPGAGDLFSAELSAAVAIETDKTFISTLISGVSAITSSGGTAENVRHDLRSMLAAVTTSARSQLFLLMPPAIAKTLASLHTNTGASAFPTMGVQGGQIINGVEAVVSDAVPSGTMILVDASQIAAASETLQLSASSEASVQMDDSPDSPSSASTNQISFWQNDLVGLRAERYFGATKLTDTGVASLSGVAYVGDSPA